MLNNPEKLKVIKDHIELVAAFSEVPAEADAEKAKKNQRRDNHALEREQKMATSAEIETRKKEEMLLLLHSDLSKYTNRVK